MNSGAPEWFFDAGTVPELAWLYHARSFMVDPSLPDGGGYVVEFVPWRAWLPKWYSPSKLYQSDPVYLMRDIDLDGVIDESLVTTMGELAIEREYDVNQITTFP